MQDHQTPKAEIQIPPSPVVESHDESKRRSPREHPSPNTTTDQAKETASVPKKLLDYPKSAKSPGKLRVSQAREGNQESNLSPKRTPSQKKSSKSPTTPSMAVQEEDQMVDLSPKLIASQQTVSLESISPAKYTEMFGSPQTDAIKSTPDDASALQTEQLSSQQVYYIRQSLLSKRAMSGSWTVLNSYIEDVERILVRTISSGENQSALIVGSAGSGKREIVKKALGHLRTTSSNFRTIYLSGGTITNETEAFREFVQQLLPDGVVGQRAISFFNMYDFLKQLLLERALAKEAVVFIVDDFDAFVGESKQLLLYNLLDWMQSKDVRIALLGISCNFNVLAQFEKRVKSRFSNIQVVVPRHPLKAFLQLLWNAFQLPRDNWPSQILAPTDTYFDKWESSLHHVLFNSQEFWQYLYDLGKPVEVFLRLMHVAITYLTTKSPWICDAHLQLAWNAMFPNHAMNALGGLTTREMTLVLGMIGLERQSKDKYSFEMIFLECQSFYRQHSMKSPPRVDLLRAIDNLLALHVVQELSHQPQQEYRMLKLLIRPKEVLDAIRRKDIACTTFVEQWAMNTLQ
ncbi:origin recognition complex subunit 4 [Aphanomyces cochlioides]|nr:origin recognition complex subunit 4 [Aphanomyces cochlioides]